MALEVPKSVRAYVAELDANASPLSDFQTIPFTMEPGVELEVAQRKGAFAEIEIWRFVRPNMFERRGPWGMYWAETASAESKDGKTHYFPDADIVDAEIIQHWAERAREAKHPNLRSRYADVGWEIGNYLREKGQRTNNASLAVIDPPVELAAIAIDAYLESVERNLFEDNSDAWQYLNRAIELSKRIGDRNRLAKSRAAFMAHREVVRSVDRHKGQTWRFYDIALEHFSEDLTKPEKTQIIADLQAELAGVADASNAATFDPHVATDTAERLEQWGQLAGNSQAGREAVLKAGEAFELAAANAGGLVAVAWLEDLLPRYRAIGNAVGAARVEEAIRRRAWDARAEMQSHSVTIEIPQEEFDAYVEGVCEGSLSEALSKVVAAGILKYDSTIEQLRKSLESAPLLSTITVSLTGPEGFTEAKLGGIEEDEEGRAFHHAAQMMGFHAGMLSRIFERILEKHKPTETQLADFIEDSTLFAKDRRTLLERGLKAWLDNDSIVAAHLLVPQLEAALRALCTRLGGAVMSHNNRYEGFRVNGMGAVLSERNLVAGVPRDVRFHLRMLFTDPRGINLRNHLAHGISMPESLSMGLCNWIIHAVLMVALFRPAKSDEAKK